MKGKNPSPGPPLGSWWAFTLPLNNKPLCPDIEYLSDRVAFRGFLDFSNLKYPARKGNCEEPARWERGSNDVSKSPVFAPLGDGCVVFVRTLRGA